MDTNPYAPPTANVDDIAPPRTLADAAPPLWNPGAAARWSLLFSPIFGSIVHMKNWQALGETGKAAQSKNWAVRSAGFFALLMVSGFFLPDSKALDLVSRAGGLGLLIAWYVQSAKAQVGYVAGRFGDAYPRRGWSRPLGYAVLCTVAFFAVVFVIALVASA